MQSLHFPIFAEPALCRVRIFIIWLTLHTQGQHFLPLPCVSNFKILTILRFSNKKVPSLHFCVCVGVPNWGWLSGAYHASHVFVKIGLNKHLFEKFTKTKGYLNKIRYFLTKKLTFSGRSTQIFVNLRRKNDVFSYPAQTQGGKMADPARRVSENSCSPCASAGWRNRSPCTQGEQKFVLTLR